MIRLHIFSLEHLAESLLCPVQDGTRLHRRAGSKEHRKGVCKAAVSECFSGHVSDASVVEVVNSAITVNNFVIDPCNKFAVSFRFAGKVVTAISLSADDKFTSLTQTNFVEMYRDRVSIYLDHIGATGLMEI